MNCDICGEKAGLPIPEIPGSFTCVSCGFVHVKERRSSAEVAKAWDDLWGGDYTSSWPAVVARQTYVAEFCEQAFGWLGKSVLDVGAGEGDFLKIIKGYSAKTTALEPSAWNCSEMRGCGVEVFEGTIQELETDKKFDVVTLLWTLENTGDCMDVLKRCHNLLKDDGLIVVATGSRILVPYKKPFHTYVSDLPPDLHCFRFSYYSLCAALRNAGFGGFHINDVHQNDAMICIGQKNTPADLNIKGGYPADDPQEVLAYFRDWKEAFP